MPTVTTAPDDPNAPPMPQALSLAPKPPKPPPKDPNAPESGLTLAQPNLQYSTAAGGAAQPSTQPPPDRVALATKAFDTFAAARAPEAQKSIERVTSQAAGMGQLGGGQWRTALRDENARNELTLSTERDRLINNAIEGTIGDRQAAEQLELAKSLGQGNLDIAKTNADTNRLGTTGNLALAEKSLTQSGSQFDKSLALQAEAQKIDAAYKAGTLTLAQAQQKLAELSNAQQDARAGQQLELAKGSLAEQAAGRLQAASQFDRSLSQSGEQFKASLAQNAAQFGLSQEQQMALAKLSDATANKSIDASTEQGKNQLLVQLAQIIGGPTGTLNPKVLEAIAKMFGVSVGDPPPPPPPVKKGDGTDIDPTTEGG